MKKIIGQVVSDKMNTTVVVKVVRWGTHPLYQKRFLTHKKYHAQNSMGAKLGDQVRLKSIRPLSKTKQWTVEEIVGRKGQE